MIQAPQNIRQLGSIELVDPDARPEPYTPSDKARRKRFRKVKNQFTGKMPPCSPLKKKSVKNEGRSSSAGSSRSSGDGTSSGPRLLLTFHPSKFDDEPGDFSQVEFTPKILTKLFQTLSRTCISSKDELFMFNPATFELKGPNGGYRTQANFKDSHGLVLDFDNGNLTPEAFEKMFWHEAGPLRKRSFFITNTYSRSPEQPNRFRVFMFLKNPATSIDQIQAVFDQVEKRLADAGHPSTVSKLDRGTRSGILSFYVPCTNRDHQDMAFFRSYGIKPDEIEKYTIDPRNYEVSQPGKAEKAWGNTSTKKPTAADVEWVEEEKRKLKSMKEGRHQPFFDFAIRLRTAGYSVQEIEGHLLDVAGTDRKMKRKAGDIMKSLEKYR